MPETVRGSARSLFLLCCALFFCGMSLMPNGEELKTLKDQGDEEAAKEKLMTEQDKSFEFVKTAILDHGLKKGDRSGDVSRKFGKPAAVDKKDAAEKWLYKARGRKKWLDVPRVWLFFDKKGRLMSWECAHTDCGETGMGIQTK